MWRWSTNQTEEDKDADGGLVVLVALVEAPETGPDDCDNVPADTETVGEEVDEDGRGDALDSTDDADDAWK